MMETPLLFIGGGAMARAIICGAVETGRINPRGIAVVDVKPEVVALLPPSLGHVTARTDIGYAWLLRAEAASRQEGQIILAVKPQSLPVVAKELRSLLTGPRVVISILAGATTQRIAEALAPHARVVRVMPNLAAQVGLGMAAICFGKGVSADDAHVARDLFSAIGRVMEIDESAMDAFTALAGSGPAYLFAFAEALTSAAVEIGFSDHDADAIVRQMLYGAAGVLVASPESAQRLKSSVTSRGGTTEAALRVLEEGRFAEMIAQALKAARDRGRDLA